MQLPTHRTALTMAVAAAANVTRSSFKPRPAGTQARLKASAHEGVKYNLSHVFTELPRHFTTHHGHCTRSQSRKLCL
jgi:hypothetical protein